MRMLLFESLFLIFFSFGQSGMAAAQTEIRVPFPESGQTIILDIPARSNIILSAEINALCVPGANGLDLVYDCTLEEDQDNPNLARTIVLQGLLALPRAQMPTFTLLDSQ